MVEESGPDVGGFGNVDQKIDLNTEVRALKDFSVRPVNPSRSTHSSTHTLYHSLNLASTTMAVGGAEGVGSWGSHFDVAAFAAYREARIRSFFHCCRGEVEAVI